MSYILLDESGDLGFDFSKKKTSRYFVVTFVFADEKRSLEKIVRTIFQGFSKSRRRHHPGTLHATKEHPSTRGKVLSMLSKKNVRILAICLNKQKVYTRFQDEKQVLYNYVTNILLDRIYTKSLVPIDAPIHLIASRRETNKFLNANFKSYLEGQVYRHHKLQIDINIRSPILEKSLQVVDFACWAIFRRREFGDESYYDLIKGRIIEESALFP